jgi:hypothetical protein
MKYVIVKYEFVENVAILGNECISHADLVLRGATATSAGFCDLLHNVSVWGGSSALDCSSKPEDAELIQRSIDFRA